MEWINFNKKKPRLTGYYLVLSPRPIMNKMYAVKKYLAYSAYAFWNGEFWQSATSVSKVGGEVIDDVAYWLFVPQQPRGLKRKIEKAIKFDSLSQDIKDLFRAKYSKAIILDTLKKVGREKELEGLR